MRASRRPWTAPPAATAYTKRITQLVADLAHSGLEVHHPLLEDRPEPKQVVLLVLTANRGMCGGFNSGVLRLAFEHYANADAGSARLSARKCPASAASPR